MLDLVSFFGLLLHYSYVGVSWFCVSLVQWLVFIVFPTGWNPYTFYVWTAWALGVCGVFNVSLGGRDMYVRLLCRLFAATHKRILMAKKLKNRLGKPDKAKPMAAAPEAATTTAATTTATTTTTTAATTTTTAVAARQTKDTDLKSPQEQAKQVHSESSSNKFGAVKVERHRVAKVIQRRSTCAKPDLNKLDTTRFDSLDGGRNAATGGTGLSQSSAAATAAAAAAAAAMGDPSWNRQTADSLATKTAVGKENTSSSEPRSDGLQHPVNYFDQKDADDLLDSEDEELCSPSKDMIRKENLQVAPTQPLVTLEKPVKDFQLNDIFPLVKKGVEAIVDDDFTKRFAAEELASWNLLTRTNKNYQFISWRLTVVWALGCVIRYVLLFPVRLILTFQAVLILVIFGSFIGSLKNSRFKRWFYSTVSLIIFRMMGRAISATITFHNIENQAKPGGICVANHTSPIDVCILCQNNVYAMVGQNQGGFLGLLQNYLGRMCNHIWFERGEDKDRLETAARMKRHVDDPNNLPILIFPEGTCVNNTSVMMFKKGSFEVDAPIYPCAIRYNPAFGDPFWDSAKHGYMMYLLRMMTSWAIVADVWFMEPMRKQPNETSMEYANRVRSMIARRGGMVELQWDGMLKRGSPKDEWKFYQRLHLGKQIGEVKDEKRPVELTQKEQAKQTDKKDHSALWTYTPKDEDVPSWLTVTKPPNPEELLKNGKAQ